MRRTPRKDTRLTKDTNLDRWAHLIGRIRAGAYPNRASNFGFDLSEYFERQHDVLAEDRGDEGGTCQWRSTAENWKCHI